jgi:signal transduction histidine kinase
MSGFDRIRNFPEKSRTVLAFLDEPVLITDPKGVLVYLNPRGEVDFGIEMRLAVGRSINEVLPDGIAKSLIKGLGRMEKNSAALRFSITESTQKYSAHLSPILKEQKLTGVVIFLRPELDQDIISRLNQSLFSTLVDEIYQPLNKLTIIFSREMDEKKAGQPFFQDSQELIKQTISGINNLIDNSPVLMGEIRLAKSKFQPSILLKLARRSFTERAKQSGLYLLRLDHKDLPELVGDQAKLNRVLVIFLDHIMTQAAPGEIVSISADLALEPDPALTYSISATGLLRTEKDFYCLTGELSDDYTRRCAEDKLKERNLVLASRLLLAMKGQVQVASLEGVGTTLSFTVPVAVAEQKIQETE